MKKAIVVGASSGIGRALALMLAQNGYHVGITGRRAMLLESLEQSFPDQFVTSVFDITDTSNLVPHLEAVVKTLGGLDLLVLSAGTGDINESLAFDIEKRTIDTNVSGFTCIVDWAYQYFHEQKSGHLAVISSIAGLRGNKLAPAYNASKAYQINYLEGLRQKAVSAHIPITITDIRPGFVATAMAKGDGQFWVAPVDKAAKQIYYVLKTKKKIAYVTRRWHFIAYVLRCLPGFIFEKM